MWEIFFYSDILTLFVLFYVALFKILIKYISIVSINQNVANDKSYADQYNDVGIEQKVKDIDVEIKNLKYRLKKYGW